MELLQEILHDLKANKSSGVIIKLDFEKAYDKVDWVPGRSPAQEECALILMVKEVNSLGAIKVLNRVIHYPLFCST